MSQTYQTEGIILKSMALGEADRLLTILSPDKGLIKAIAPGARKPKSKLGGRTSLFVVNQMMCLKGRSLDKLLQADVQESFPGLSRNLAKLTIAQYWAEIVLLQSLSGHSDPKLYELQLKLLKQLEQTGDHETLKLLIQGISQLLVVAGIAPEVAHCCLSQTSLHPDMFTSRQGVYFSCEEGGTVIGDRLFNQTKIENLPRKGSKTDYTKIGERVFQPRVRESTDSSPRYRLTLSQWIILNHVSFQQSRCEQSRCKEQTQHPNALGLSAWLSVEKILRGYAQHHFERTIQSASLIDSVFAESFTPEPTP